MEQAEKRWQTFGFSIILFAALILSYGLYRLRLQRIANTGTEFLTGFFLILVIATVIAHALLLVGLWRYQKQLSPRLSIGFSLLSLITWGILNQFISGFRVYAGAYLIWLIVLNFGLLLIANRASLAKWKWQGTARGLVLVLFGIALSFFMLELAMRVYFGVFGSESDKVAYLYSVDEILASANRYLGYPYINYGLSPTHPEHNRYNLRGQPSANEHR